MNSLPIKEIIGAIATLVVAWLAYRQWLRGKRSGTFLQDREAAYKAVWNALEEAHLLVRSFTPSSELGTAVKAANALVMKHSLHLRPADRPRIEAYLHALIELADTVGIADWTSTSDSEFALTAERPALPAEVTASYRLFVNARNEAITAFREALGADAIR